MPNRQSVQRRLLPALAGAVLLVCALAAAAAADPYGELGHFGGVGTGHGQFKITSGTHAFGVDTSEEDSVYVGDEPQLGQYRVQKLTATGAFVAATNLLKPTRHMGIEGIAIDPALKRVYVLAVEERKVGLERDPGAPAAGALYAFSTEPSGEVLVPAVGTNATGVLASSGVLESESDVAEKALLKPRGIAVDPTTHDVVIMGEVNQAPSGEEESKLRVALERIHSDGALGERYVDNNDFFGEEEFQQVNSPVVSSSGAVYVERTGTTSILQFEVESGQIVRIPSDFSSTQTPEPFVRYVPVGIGIESGERAIVQFNSGETPLNGDGLSIAPEEGTIYTRARIAGAKSYYPGVLAFSGTNGSEIGWTGGQVSKSAGEACAIGFRGATYSLVAAGSAHRVLMLEPESGRVVEFGPEGRGCPTAEATSPTATVNGNPLSETVSITTPITLSSTMTQANALSVEWNFGDGTTETKSEDEYQHTEVEHTFAQSGELTVTETIHTDDLATPTIVKTTKISVSANALPPTAVLEGPREVTLGGGGPPGLVYLEGGGLGMEAAPGGEATFDGSASFDPNPPGSNRIEAYHWSFGDGHSEATEATTVTHRYEQPGEYKVELTVTDVHELTSKPSALTVKVNPAPPAPAGPVTTQPVAPPLALAAVLVPAQPTLPPPVPNARLSSAALAASSSGTVGLEVTCPVGESNCAGTVTLRTLGAVSISAAHKRRSTKKGRATVLTLASGTFTVAGGQRKSVTLHLSARARALLARTHMVQAQATLTAHDSAGATYSSQIPVVLKAAGAAHTRPHGR